MVSLSCLSRFYSSNVMSSQDKEGEKSSEETVLFATVMAVTLLEKNTLETLGLKKLSVALEKT